MKKITLIAVLVMATLGLAAQPKTLKDPVCKYSMELQFNPFSNNFQTFKMTDLKMRYYLDDYNVIRATLGFGYDRNTNTSLSDNNDPSIILTESYSKSNQESKYTSVGNSFKFGLGYESHMTIFDSFEVYAGAEIGYEGKFYSAKNVTTSSSVNQSVYDNTWAGYMQTSKTSVNSENTKKYYKSDNAGNHTSHGFYLNGVLGADWYVYGNLYLGAEIGLGISTSKSAKAYYTTSGKSTTVKNVVYKKTTGEIPSDVVYPNATTTTTVTDEFSSKTGQGTTTTVVDATDRTLNGTTTNKYYNATSESSVSSFNIRLFAVPALRLGIRF